MKLIGANLLVRTLKGLADGTLKEIPQLLVLSRNLQEPNSRLTPDDSRLLKHAPKIFTETCRINWSKPVDEVYNLIRGLAPYPAAFTFLNDKKLKVFKAEKGNNIDSFAPGCFKTDHKTYLRFACANGYISILELQFEGKKKLLIADFLRGYRF